MIGRDEAARLEEKWSPLGLRAGGAPLHRARAVALAFHGRGSDPSDMLALGEALAQPDLAILAPAAPGRSWWPAPFIAPRAMNEPAASRAFAMASGLLDDLAAAGVPVEKTILTGFSQGACLAVETAIVRPGPYGAVLCLAGGFFGPMTDAPRKAAGSLAGARVLVACGEADSHIPLQRVRETAELARDMGAEVDLRTYPGFGHGLNDDMLGAARKAVVAAMEAAVIAS